MSDARHRSIVGLLAFVAAIAPFNIKVTASEWTALGLRPLVIISLVAVVGVIGVNLRNGPSRPDRIDMLAYGLCGSIWLSALLSENVLLGSGGAARLSVAILLIPALRGTVATERDAHFVLAGLGCGAVAASCLALAWWQWGDGLDPTAVFVGRVTQLGSYDRLTRPWAHANVAAMALGASIAGVAALPRRFRVLALVPVIVALVLTISRGGLMALSAAALMWIVLRRNVRDVVVVASLIAIAALVALSSAAWTTRAEQLGDEAFYAVTIDPPFDFVVDATDGEDLVAVTVTNDSVTLWPRAGDERVLISARWFGTDGQIWSEDWWELPKDLAPGESLTAELLVEARVPDGAYDVWWDLVIPDTAYFGQFLGEDPFISTVNVSASDVAVSDVFRYDLVERTVDIGRIDTWRLAIREFRSAPLFGVGPNQFGDRELNDLSAAGSRVGSHAHNIVLEPLAAWGLFGAIPFFMLGIGAVSRTTKRAWQSRSLVAAAVATGLAAVLAHGLVDWPLVVITTGIPVGVLVGLAWSDWVGSDESQRSL